MPSLVTVTVLDIDQTTATTFSLYGSLPTYRRTLFSYSVTFTVWIVPVTLSVNLEVYLGGYVYLNGDLVNAEATVTPSATVSLSASVSVSILVIAVLSHAEYKNNVFIRRLVEQDSCSVEIFTIASLLKCHSALVHMIQVQALKSTKSGLRSPSHYQHGPKQEELHGAG